MDQNFLTPVATINVIVYIKLQKKRKSEIGGIQYSVLLGFVFNTSKF